MNDKERIKELETEVKKLGEWKQETLESIRYVLNLSLDIPGVIPQSLKDED